MNRSTLRRLHKVNIQRKLSCMVHNLEKIGRTLANGRLILDTNPIFDSLVSCMSRKRKVVAIAGIALSALIIAVAPRAFPMVLKWLHPEITFSIPSNRRVIYLTIDDVPSAATPEILSVLKKYDVKATFFVIGSWVHDKASLSEIVMSGSRLGHHMWTTEACTKLDGDRFEAQFDENDRLLRSYRKASYFRPPSDFGTKRQMAYVVTHGYKPVLGTVFPFDSSISSVPILKIMVKWLAVPGGILIMHDGRERGFRTAKVLRRVCKINE